MYNINDLGVFKPYKSEYTNKNGLSLISIMKRPILISFHKIFNYYHYRVIFYNFKALNRIFQLFLLLCHKTSNKTIINLFKKNNT